MVPLFIQTIHTMKKTAAALAAVVGTLATNPVSASTVMKEESSGFLSFLMEICSFIMKWFSVQPPA